MNKIKWDESDKKIFIAVLISLVMIAFWMMFCYWLEAYSIRKDQCLYNCEIHCKVEDLKNTLKTYK